MRPEVALLILLLVVPFLFPWLFQEVINGRHSWAQADHFSIAQKFSEQRNLFVPHSHNLAPDFMGEQRTAVDSGITRADFPIVHWVAGQVMYFLPGQDLRIARFVFYLFSALGLWFFARAVAERTRRPWLSMFTVVLLFAGPLWLYYSTAVMPSTLSLAALMTSLWTGGRFVRCNSTGYFIWTIVLLALAALMRPPAVAFGLAFGLWCLETGRLKGVRRWSVCLAVILLCVFYSWHSIRLGRLHGSLFLSSADWGLNFWQLFQVWGEGMARYLSVVGPFLLPALIAMVLFVQGKTARGSVIRAGLLSVLLLMGYQIMAAPQFRDHDYYLLDTLVPLSVVMLYVASVAWMKRSWFMPLLAGVMSFLAWYNHGGDYHRRFDFSNHLDRVQGAFIGSEAFLDQLGVEPEAPVLAIDTYSTNMALLLMNRDGYNVAVPSQEDVLNGLDYPWEYVIIPRTSMDEPWVASTGLRDKLFCVASNGLIGVYIRRPEYREPQSMDAFSGDALVGLDCLQANSPGDLLEAGEWPWNYNWDGFPAAWLDTPLPRSIRITLSCFAERVQGQAFIVVKTPSGYAQQELVAGQQCVVELIAPGWLEQASAYIWNPGQGEFLLRELNAEYCIGLSN